jgi:hypothetical protein
MGRDAALWRNLLHLAPYSAEAGTIRRLTPEELGAAVDASQFNREDADMEASARHAAQLNEQLAQQFTLKDPSSSLRGGDGAWQVRSTLATKMCNMTVTISVKS